VARFVRETGRRVELHLVRKGWDVVPTERLVAEERLGDHVVWHDEMTQDQLFALMRNAEVVIEQLDRSLPGSGGVDAMALGRPVIGNWRRDVIPEYRRLPDAALCQASNEVEVQAQLGRLLLDRSELERVSREARRAVVEHLSSDVAAQECERHLGALCAGAPRR
jgi:glycosyltransferase involved in cell wall biosynthesis